MLKELKETSKLKLQETERKIVQARLTDISLNQLSETDLRADVDLLIFKICAISGADLPATDFFANILSQELLKYLMEFGYAEFTSEEILLAFRFNAVGIKYPSGDYIEKIYFKGVLNINLIATVVGYYKILRESLDRRFQNEIDGY